MAEVINRAARRAAAAGTRKIETGIYVIPMDLVEPYYYTQIAREGLWNDDPPVIITRPREEVGRADDAWIERTLTQMRDVRKPGTNRYVFPGEDRETDIDIGLIDVQVYFPATAGKLTDHHMTDENFQAVDTLCGNTLHTQMVLASAVHGYRPDGSRILHYHNLIFSLRKEYDGDLTHIGILDMLPLVKALGTDRTLQIVEEV